MESMLPAEPAILVHLQAVRCVLLIFCGVVVALFALCASKGNPDCHNGTSIDFGFTSLPQQKRAEKNNPP
jgi:hypothetical protein